LYSFNPDRLLAGAAKTIGITGGRVAGGAAAMSSADFFCSGLSGAQDIDQAESPHSKAAVPRGADFASKAASEPAVSSVPGIEGSAVWRRTRCYPRPRNDVAKWFAREH